MNEVTIYIDQGLKVIYNTNMSADLIKQSLVLAKTNDKLYTVDENYFIFGKHIKSFIIKPIKEEDTNAK